MTTTVGPITLELDADNAPKTVENFLSYVSNGFYDGTIFHRVINNFMIQGGGFTAEMEQKATEAPIENEANNGLENARGTIAMARTQDPHSATAQFFINVQDNDFLNHTGENMQGWGYAVFGKVTDGEGVLEKIRCVQTGSQAGHQDVPVEPIIIESVTVIAD
jgi:peptidyl-prolyl cis-trans isomerase B (cyclophilin B)